MIVRRTRVLVLFGEKWQRLFQMRETHQVIGDGQSDGAGKQAWSCPFEGLIIPETELLTEGTATEQEATVAEKVATVTE